MLATSPLGRKANRFDWLQRVVLGVGKDQRDGDGEGDDLGRDIVELVKDELGSERCQIGVK